MAVDEGLRKLAAILAADVAGYSRLMADDERATVRTLTAYREIFSANVGAHQGRIVDTAGDSVLATFDSVVEAVEAAVEVQRALGLRNEELPGHRQMHFRIGVNLGDIIHRDDGTIYGDGVNIAARLESLAEPGGVMVADIAAQAIEGKLGVDLADAGAHEVKNIAKPVRAWRVVVEGEVLGAAGPPDAKTLRRPKLVAGLVAGLAILVGLAVWGLTIRIEVPQMVKADGTPTDDPVLAMPIGPSIAVLPFENLSDGEERSYFADGLTEELITALSRFQDLKVIARHSTLRYKDQAVDVRAVAEELVVGYIVVGSVRRSTDAVRITVQLLEGQDGSHLWSETYDRALTAANLIAIQDELASQIVDRVAGAYGEIARRMAAAARKKSPASLDSYDCILRAYAFLEVLTPEENLRVRDCLEAVIAEDPDNVEALAWLASRYAEEFALGFNPEPESLERALTMARRAARLDPSNQWARHIYAWVLFFTGDFTEFRAEAERAIQLNPNNALTLGDLGLQIAYSGEWERGLALVQKAIALNPFHPGWYLFPFYFERYYANDYATALDYQPVDEVGTGHKRPGLIL